MYEKLRNRNRAEAEINEGEVKEGVRHIRENHGGRVHKQQHGVVSLAASQSGALASLMAYRQRQQRNNIKRGDGNGVSGEISGSSCGIAYNNIKCITATSLLWHAQRISIEKWRMKAARHLMAGENGVSVAAIMSGVMSSAGNVSISIICVMASRIEMAGMVSGENDEAA